MGTFNNEGKFMSEDSGKTEKLDLSELKKYTKSESETLAEANRASGFGVPMQTTIIPVRKKKDKDAKITNLIDEINMNDSKEEPIYQTSIFPKLKRKLENTGIIPVFGKNKIKKDSKNNNLKTVNKDLLQSKLNETIKEAKKENKEEVKEEAIAKKIVNSSDIKLDSKNKVDNSEFGIVKKKIEDIKENNNVYKYGTVVSIKEFIIEVVGLDDVFFYEKIKIADKGIGYVIKISVNSVSVALLEKHAPLAIGDYAYQTNEEYKGMYSEDAMGRIVNLFGIDQLANKTFSNLVEIPIERPNIPLMDRTKVERPLETGISGIDLIYPIGRGQRQLIIGDKKTGKTQICLDTIVNQKGKHVICIYCAIGKTKKEVKEIYYNLMKKGATEYTVIITAFNDDLAPVLSLTPYYALSVAQEYMMKGFDVLVCLDDLKRHADIYREIGLIFGKNPGRDAYPSDIFYVHSRLLEKGCQYKNGASITILPVIETKGGDITDFISTNVISITDGQIVLSTKNYQKGIKPAIDYGLSVSRLGGAVQTENMKKLGSKVRRKLLSYLETSKVYELANVDEMSPELRNLLLSGKDVLNALIQPKFSPRTEEEMLDKFSKLIEASEKAEEENKEDQKRDKKEDSNDQDNNSNTNGNVEEPKEETKEEPKEVIPETPVNSETNNDLELPEAEEDVETNG